MNSSQKIVWSIVGIIALILIGAGFYFSNKQQPSEPTAQVEENAVPAPVTVDVKHQVIGQTHTVAGSIELPTPCHTLQTTADVNTTSNTAVIKFVASTTAETCAQVITSKTFKVQFTGASDINIMGTFNGKTINLNIFEVPADENIDTFQIYNKG